MPEAEIAIPELVREQPDPETERRAEMVLPVAVLAAPRWNGTRASIAAVEDRSKRVTSDG